MVALILDHVRVVVSEEVAHLLVLPAAKTPASIRAVDQCVVSMIPMHAIPIAE